MFGLSKEELRTLKKLNTPKKIQDFIDKIPINFEQDGYTFLSPRRVLRENRAHCIEAACLAALALRLQGQKALILDLTSNKKDEDHVIAVFKQHGHWGAISKTNHATLRYREPVYKTIRELVMSYFHEYFTNHNGKKTLRSYSQPINLAYFDKKGWITDEENLWYIVEHIFKIPHTNILSRKQIAVLRKADPIEIDAGKLTEWKKRVSPHPWKKE